jgi:creatinine amidohydrolase
MLAAMPQAVRAGESANATPATVAMAREFKWLGAHRPAGFAWMTQDLNATGAIGDATPATAAKGDAVLTHGAQAFVELLREIDRFDLARLREGPLAT